MKPITTAFGLIAVLVVDASAQTASLDELKRTSPRLPTDVNMECAELRRGIVQLSRNIAAIDAELTAGRTAMEDYTKFRADGGITFVDSNQVEVEAPHDIRWGMRKLEEIRRIAVWRVAWLESLEGERGCRAEVIIEDPEP